MSAYFEAPDSIAYRLGTDPGDVVSAVAERYIGANPPIPYMLRAFSRAGIAQGEDGLYRLDFGGRFPGAAAGSYAYAFGLVWSDTERGLDLALHCLGPVRLFLNGKLIYRSNAVDEARPDRKVTVEANFVKGWNSLFVKARCTPAGFGCLLGAEEAKVRILNVLAPFSGRSGQAGWAYSEPSETDVYGEDALPDGLADERGEPVRWLPDMIWTEEAAARPVCERLYGLQPGRKAWARSKLRVETRGATVAWRGRSEGSLRVWVNGRLLEACSSADGTFGAHSAEVAFGSRSVEDAFGARSIEDEPEASTALTYGLHDVLVEIGCGQSSWEWALTAAIEGSSCGFELPVAVQGAQAAGSWLYLGAADREEELEPDKAMDLSRVHGRSGMYWRLDLPETWVRPYYENAMLSNKWTTGGATNYARWDYPLGVTMYGLLRAGRALGREDFVAYALEHVRACTNYYEYALWDRDQYGFPSVNHQLVLIRMLDNCGSFGSAMLEADVGRIACEASGDRQTEGEGSAAGVITFEESKERWMEGETSTVGRIADVGCVVERIASEASGDPRTGGEGSAVGRIADDIADFMLHRLERRKEDGAFFRVCGGEYAENTLWADDLYMSAPFLVRYYLRTGERSALDEAVRQFLLYRQYLFMPESKLMSHVHDFKHGQATGVPWGRGNGWTVFSLSELLAVAPEDHPQRAQLLSFFNELCEGYLAVQGDNGLWRQVLDQQSAYEEASCTAMFVYAFARGVRYGWLSDEADYVRAAILGWEGLTRLAIDREGNVYGVCSGSRYSFSPDYYMHDLKPVTNDNHGIGIMLLVGVEIRLLTEWLASENGVTAASSAEK